jgi:hypothetical protein
MFGNLTLVYGHSSLYAVRKGKAKAKSKSKNVSGEKITQAKADRS